MCGATAGGYEAQVMPRLAPDGMEKHDRYAFGGYLGHHVAARHRGSPRTGDTRRAATVTRGHLGAVPLSAVPTGCSACLAPELRGSVARAVAVKVRARARGPARNPAV